MNYDYNQGEPFYEVTFPTRNVQVALFRVKDFLQAQQKIDEDTNKPYVRFWIGNYDKSNEWIFDGTMEELKKNCKLIYL